MITHSSKSALLLFIAYLGFISLGLPDTIIGVAWPSVRSTFQLQQSAIALIFFGAGLSYFLSSFFAGRALEYLGIGAILAVSSALVATSAFGYALAPVWFLFAACSVLHGLGSGAIDAGLNHYAAHHLSARQMNWLHACYSLGAMLGPLIMTAVVVSGDSWRRGYFAVACVLVALAVLFTVTRRRWESPENSPAAAPEVPQKIGMAAVLGLPTVRLQTIIFFVYTGLEVTVGQWSFTLLTESRAVSPATAGAAVTGFWASIAIGRILFGSVVERLGIDRFLRGSMVMALAGTLLLACRFSAPVSAIALALTGLGLAAVYPCLMTRTPQRIGKGAAAHAIGFQVSAAMLGAAALPALTGVLVQRLGLESIGVAAIVMAVLLCFLHENLLRRPGVGA